MKDYLLATMFSAFGHQKHSEEPQECTLPSSGSVTVPPQAQE